MIPSGPLMLPEPLVRVVDDDDRVRQSEGFVLRLDGWQVAEHASALKLLEQDDFRRPGCIVLDIRMPEMSGLELQIELRRRGVTQPILFLTGHDDVDAAVMALKRGAADFVRKPMEPEALQAAVRRLVSWHADLARREALHARAAAQYEALTAKEREILRAVASGALNKQIAIDLGISEQTVKTHRGSVTRKLGLRSAVELAEFLRELDAAPDRTFRIAADEAINEALNSKEDKP